MKERTQILLVVLAILAVSGIQIYLYMFLTDFGFSRAELNINNNQITEKLTFYPNKAYHTLYRDFNSLNVESNVSAMNIYDEKFFLEAGGILSLCNVS